MNLPCSTVDCIQTDDFDGGTYREVGDLIFQQAVLKSEQEEYQAQSKESNPVLEWGAENAKQKKPKHSPGGFCDTCGKQYSNLKQHLVVHDPLRSKEFKCNICGKEFLSKQGWKEHMGLHSESSSHKCTHCEKEFVGKTGLNRHIKMKHLLTNEYKCDVCGEFFNTQYLLTCHSKKHTRPHQCDVCGRGFAWKEVLRDHILTHTGEKPFVCLVCDSKFRQKSTLRSHVKFVHEGQKKLTCEKCGHKAARKEDMKKHMRTHGVGLKLFSCNKCSLVVRTAFTLRRHMEIHSRHFSCEICGTLFPTKRTFQKHADIYKGQQPIKCSQCNRRFHHQKTADEHFLADHKCNIFDQQFSSVSVVVQIDLYDDDVTDNHLQGASDDEYNVETKREGSFAIGEQNVKDLCPHENVINESEQGSCIEEGMTKHIIDSSGRDFSVSYSEDCQSAFGTNDDGVNTNTGTIADKDMLHSVNDCDLSLPDVVMSVNRHQQDLSDELFVFRESQHLKTAEMEIQRLSKGVIYGDKFNEKLLDVSEDSAGFQKVLLNSKKRSIQVTEQDFQGAEREQGNSLTLIKQALKMSGIDGGNSTVKQVETNVTLTTCTPASSGAYSQSLQQNFSSNRTVEDNSECALNKKKLQAKRVCDTCGKAVINLVQHKAIHSTESRFCCKICGLRFKTASHLYAHMSNHPEGMPIKCLHCPKRFRTLRQLSEHTSAHTGKKPFVCKVCGKAYLRQKTLHVHSRTHTGLRPYSCRFCGKHFAHSSVKVDHERIHTGQKPHVCDVCGKGFAQRSSLRSHAVVHANERKFECQFCGHTALRKPDLVKHLETHGERKAFKCEICDRNLTGRRSFSQHMSKHKKLHKVCDICGKNFKTEEKFNAHLKRYDKRSPVSCGLCEKLFHSKVLASRHMKNHAGAEKRKRFSCHLCKFTCWTASLLTAHAAKYEKLNPVVCGVCDKLFHTKVHMRRHMFIHKAQEDVKNI